MAWMGFEMHISLPLMLDASYFSSISGFLFIKVMNPVWFRDYQNSSSHRGSAFSAGITGHIRCRCRYMASIWLLSFLSLIFWCFSLAHIGGRKPRSEVLSLDEYISLSRRSFAILLLQYFFPLCHHAYAFIYFLDYSRFLLEVIINRATYTLDILIGCSVDTAIAPIEDVFSIRRAWVYC